MKAMYQSVEHTLPPKVKIKTNNSVKRHRSPPYRKIESRLKSIIDIQFNPELEQKLSRNIKSVPHSR